MILLQKLQAHPKVYICGKYLTSRKLLEGKLFLFCAPQRKVEDKMKWNETLIAFAKIPERKGNISPSCFYKQVPDY